MFQLIHERLEILRKNAAARWNVADKDCHIGHLTLQAMLQEPLLVCQIDGATDQKETNLSVATRSTQLASAMANYGLNTGDRVIIMGNNHLDLCIPFFACHFNGYSVCAVDPTCAADLVNLWPYVEPNIIFCQKNCEDKVKNAFAINSTKCEVVIFDDDEADLKTFVKKHNGIKVNYRPVMFDPSKTTGWLILTSGTTGLPKVSIIPFDTALNAVHCWWEPTKQHVDLCYIMATLQWISGLIFCISGPLRGFTRLQSSSPPTPQAIVGLINKYKPCVTAWTPFLLGRFIEAAGSVCDLSCFKIILIGGCAIPKSLLDQFKKVCNAEIRLIYGMTELLVPVFNFNKNTPFGSSGKPMHDKYEYKLVDSDGQVLKNANETGELWIKSDTFFKGYRNNPDETRLILKEDGWVATGDVFYKDDKDFYYFVERTRLIIKHYGLQISPLQMEEVLKRHPGVAEACVVQLPVVECLELPVAAILKKDGEDVNFKELFDLLDKNIAIGRKLRTGFFFVDSFSVTPSGKVHRAKLKEIAENVPLKIFNRKYLNGSKNIHNGTT